MDSAESSTRKIFVGGLSFSTNDDKLRDYFEAFGPVQDSVVMKDPLTKRSRGFGFITFEDPLYVDIALEQDVHIIDSRRVEAKRAVPQPNSSGKPSPSPATPATPAVAKTPAPVVLAPAATNPSPTAANGSASDSKYNSEEYAYHKIFVGGLHYETRAGPFRGYFERYGRVLSAEVMFNRETHKSRGFGFIIFELESSVDLVCEEKDHIIDGKMVEVKRAVPRTKLPPSASGHASSAAKAQSASALSSKAIPPVASAPSAKPAEAKKSIPSAIPKSTTGTSIASIGIKAKVSQSKPVGSYAAALKAGSSSADQEPTPDSVSSESETAWGTTTSSSSELPTDIAPPAASYQWSPSLAMQSAHGMSVEAAVAQSHMSSPGSSAFFNQATGNAQQQPYPPSMVLPQSMMPQQGPSFHQMQQAQMMQHYNQMHPGSASHMQHHMQMQGQAMSHHQSLGQPPFAGMNGMEFDGFGMPINRPMRALSESFLPPKFPSQVQGGGGYYGMPPPQMPQSSQMHMSSSPHMGGSSPGTSGTANSASGSPHRSYQGADFWKDSQMTQSNASIPGIGWMSTSFPGVSSGREGSEVDSSGEDAISMALRMDLRGIDGSMRMAEGINRSLSESHSYPRQRPPPSADMFSVDSRSAYDMTGISGQMHGRDDVSARFGGMNMGVSSLVGNYGYPSQQQQPVPSTQLQPSQEFDFNLSSMSATTPVSSSSPLQRPTNDSDLYSSFQFQELNSNSAEFNPSSRSWR